MSWIGKSGTRDHNVKQNKSVSDRQISHISSNDSNNKKKKYQEAKE